MKKTIIYFTALLLAYSCTNKPTEEVKSNGGYDKLSATDFTTDDLTQYCHMVHYTLVKKLLSEVSDSLLTVYADADFKKALPTEFFNTHDTIKDDIEIDVGDDPVEFIGTDVAVPIRPERIDGYTINQNTLTLHLSPTEDVFFKWNEVQKKLNGQQLALLNFFTDAQAVNYETLEVFAKQKFATLKTNLLQWGLKGDMPAYVFAEMKKTYTKEEIEERLTIRDYMQLPNPNNPNDIYDIIDSVVVTPINHDSLKHVRVYFAWNNDDKNFTSTVSHYSFAPLFTPIAAGIELPLAPIFFLKGVDVWQKFDDNNRALFYQFTMALMRNKGNFTTYNNETFQDIEY